MIKKILKWTGIGIGGILALVVVASIIIMFIINKEMVAAQMEKALNRHVTIGDVSVGIFSMVSGIEVNDVKISNYKTPEQLKALEGKPVEGGDIFVGLKSFKFKVEFLPLLSRKFVLKQLVLYEPVINVVKGKEGGFNFDDLTRPKKLTAEEKAELEKQKVEDAKRAAEEAKKPSQPLTVDDIPVDISIGKVGIEKGVVTFVDRGLDQTFQVYNMTLLVHSIDIVPKEIENHDSVGLRVEMGVKSVGTVKSGTVQSFDIGFAVNGSVKPFDVKTRRLDPEVAAKVGMPYGMMTGLQIFEKIKSVEALSKYCGKLDFLQKEMKWRDAFVSVWYKAGTARLSDGRISTDDYLLTFAGMVNTITKAVGLNLDMVLADKHQATIRSGIEKNAGKLITGRVAQYVKADKVADVAMKRLVNAENKVYLKFDVSGTMNNPSTKLVHPQLPGLGDLVSDAAGGLADVAKDKAKAVAQKAVTRGADKVKDKVGSRLKKLF